MIEFDISQPTQQDLERWCHKTGFICLVFFIFNFLYSILDDKALLRSSKQIAYLFEIKKVISYYYIILGYEHKKARGCEAVDRKEGTGEK